MNQGSESDEAPVVRGRGRWWWAMGGAALLVVGGLAAVVWVRSNDVDCGRSAGTGVTSASAVSSDGEELKVAEFGAWGYGIGEGYEKMSFGVVLENPSRDVATNVRFSYHFLDSEGGPGLDPQLESDGGQLTVKVIQPGQGIGIGGFADTVSGEPALDGKDLFHVDYEHLRIKVEVESAEWWPVHNDRFDFAPVSATVDGFELGEDAGLPGGEQLPTATVDYSLTISDCVPNNLVNATVLFRNATGEIIGGSDGIVSAARAATVSDDPDPDELIRRYQDDGIPVDTAKIEIFPQPDPIALHD